MCTAHVKELYSQTITVIGKVQGSNRFLNAEVKVYWSIVSNQLTEILHCVKWLPWYFRILTNLLFLTQSIFESFSMLPDLCNFDICHL